jgi:hypothetical protein
MVEFGYVCMDGCGLLMWHVGERCKGVGECMQRSR